MKRAWCSYCSELMAFWTVGLCVLIAGKVAAALDVNVEGFRVAISPYNVGGGFDYLPDGDILAFSSDYTNGPSLYRIDANGDGLPAQPQVILSYDLSSFPAFVKVSPSGRFALFATSGAVNTLRRLDLSDYSVSDVADIAGSFDLAFIDDETVFVSANTGGRDTSIPNRVFRIALQDPEDMVSVLEIGDTPSGPIALNSSGDLYYIKSTWTYPARPMSSRLMRFSASDLEEAAENGVVLAEGDSEIEVALAGGYDIEVNRRGASADVIYVSQLSDVILAIGEDDLRPRSYFTAVDPGGLSAPALTAMAFFKPEGRFEAYGPQGTRLGISASTDLFSAFSLIEIEPAKDSDGDAVCDYQEIEDGTDPNDRGSVSPELRSPVYALWNGFLEMVNILEMVNYGSEALDVRVSLIRLDGTLGSVQSINLSPSGQFDVILNDVEGFERNAYGLVKLEYEGELDGRVSFYRAGAEEKGSYDFAFALPLSNPRYGETAAVFNTYYPDAGKKEGALTANWLSIVNLAEESKRFTVRRHDQLGSVLASETVELAAGQRVDLEAGHANPGPDRVGLNVVAPEDARSPYLAELTRYGYDGEGGFSFAFSLASRAGTGRPINAAIANESDSVNWLEVVNTADEDSLATVRCYDAAGTEQAQWNIGLAAYEQRHFEVSALLGAEEAGSCSLSSSEGGALVSESMSYYRDPVGGSLVAITGVPAREPLGSRLFGSYNLFLEMENELRVTNAGPQSIRVRLDVNAGAASAEEEIPAFSTSSFLLHDHARYATASDSYGTFSVESDIAGSVSAALVRKRFLSRGSGAVDFVMPTEVR